MFTTLAADMVEVIPVLAIGGAFVVAIIGMVGGFIKQVLVARAKEQSRREIAAYIAEGSMSADEGAKLMDAGMRRWERPRGC
jgi:hypothetical protein